MLHPLWIFPQLRGIVTGAMLSIGKLGQGQADYYLKAVGQGIEDYYTGKGEAPGWWTGAAADELDVFGQVEGELLHRALTGQHPKTASQLAKPPRGGIRVPGFDLTFSAPKSVSVLYGLGDPEVSAQVRDAHEAAVEAALGYMERHAAVGRRGRGGAIAVAGNGFLGAAFRHRTSRAGDPQLHTHVLVANMTRGPDGRWTALDARRLYAHAKTGGYLYQAHLRAELTRRLGVDWTPVRRGQAEITGIPAAVLRAFSRRRSEITAQLDQRGEASSRAAQMAALDTRHAKDYAVDAETLGERWWRRAEQLGLTPGDLDRCLRRAQARELAGGEVDRAYDQLAGPDGLTRQRSSFTRRDALRAWCEQLPHGAPVERVEALGDQLLASDRVIALATGGLVGENSIRRTDGRVVPAAREERPYSTPELLALEHAVIDRALAGRDDARGIVDEAHVDAALARRPTLSDEQATMVRRLLRDGAAVQLVVGKAGTGKTFAMDAAREAWQADGYQVIGAALARRAAHELRDGAGIDATSIAALLADLRDGDPADLLAHGRTVLVVDEAGMVGTRQLAELLRYADRADAKVVLLGDPRQLPEIDAGGIFRGLAIRARPIQLTENRRQHHAWEHQALELLRTGRAAEAIARYQRHGRIVLADTAPAIREQLVADWWHARQQGANAIMVAARRDDVADLNAHARARMTAAGHLGPDAVEIRGRTFAVGDHVVTLRNAPALGVVNGTLATIAHIDRGRGEITLRTADQRELRLTASYLDPPHEPTARRLDHAYAITGHKAQGMTADAAFVLGTEDLYREWGYVALSRGRTTNRLYLVAPEPPDRDEYAPTTPQPDAIDMAIHALSRSHAQLLALDTAYATELTALPTAALRERVDKLRAELSLSPGGGVDAQLSALARERQSTEQAAADARARMASTPADQAHDRAAAHAAEQQAQRRLRAIADRERQLRDARGPEQSPPALTRAAELLAARDELRRRRAGATRATTIDPPAYLIDALGPIPERPSRRRHWNRLAARIEDYRDTYAIDDPALALGTEPRDIAQRAAWRELRLSIEHHHDHSHERTPPSGRSIAD